MKKDELNKLKIKDFLPVVYEDLEPHLIAELNRLLEELISLPEDTNEKELLSIFEKSVNNLNKIDQDESIESGIDTEEREGLCEALSVIGAILGLDKDGDYLDEWREW